jgi:hypothetical protein
LVEPAGPVVGDRLLKQLLEPSGSHGGSSPRPTAAREPPRVAAGLGG